MCAGQRGESQECEEVGRPQPRRREHAHDGDEDGGDAVRDRPLQLRGRQAVYAGDAGGEEARGGQERCKRYRNMVRRGRELQDVSLATQQRTQEREGRVHGDAEPGGGVPGHEDAEEEVGEDARHCGGQHGGHGGAEGDGRGGRKVGHAAGRGAQGEEERRCHKTVGGVGDPRGHRDEGHAEHVEEDGRGVHVGVGGRQAGERGEGAEGGEGVVAHVLQRGGAGVPRVVDGRVVHVAVVVEGHVHAGGRDIRLRVLLHRPAAAVGALARGHGPCKVAVDAEVGVGGDELVHEDVLGQHRGVGMRQLGGQQAGQPRVAGTRLEDDGGPAAAHGLHVDEGHNVAAPRVPRSKAVGGLQEGLLRAVEVEHHVPREAVGLGTATQDGNTRVRTHAAGRQGGGAAGGRTPGARGRAATPA